MNTSTESNVESRKIFVDTWAWYALIDRSDTDHKTAKTVNTRLINQGHTFVTTNFVLSESLTLIRYKMRHDIAVRFWETTRQLDKSGLVEIVRVNQAHEERAWKIFRHYIDQDFSFTDCTSFAVMQELQLSRAFTRDHHFMTMGFIIVP
jgi:predicted nucleic acid-binding protein